MLKNKNFYPTPPEVIDQMLLGLDLSLSTVLEPSAGSGSIIDKIKPLGAHVLACENDPELSMIVKSKCDKFLCEDFMDVQENDITHVDYILMNPPFDRGDKHILHAWNISPEGCIIKALCNSTTIDNTYSRTRNELATLIEHNGNAENLGEVFATADRKTDVSVSLVTLYKPKTGDSEFEGFFDTQEEEEAQANGLIQYNEIREIVNRYIAAVKMFDQVEEASAQINSLASVFSTHHKIRFGAHSVDSNNRYNTITRDVYKKDLQKSAWKTVFSKLKMDKYVTEKVMKKLNNFVEKQTNVPFKMSNIYRMIDMIIQTYEENMNESIVDIFEKLTRHTKENRHSVEGWVSNSDYLFSKKFIMPFMSEHSYEGGMGIKYNGNYKLVDDLTKALCFLTGRNYSEIGGLWEFFHNSYIRDPEHYDNESRREKKRKEYQGYCRNKGVEVDIDKENAYIEEQIQRDVKNCNERMKFDFGTWYDFGFFQLKGFKKGTMHFRFKKESDWVKLNQRIAKIKGWGLPEKF